MTVAPNTGVYQIFCVVSGKRYIGSTQVGFKRRWNSHLQVLRKNSHHSQHLQFAFNKYGEDAFKFEVLEAISEPYVLSLEQAYLNWYRSFDGHHGYNICPVAGNCTGIKQSDATKAKRSASLKAVLSNPDIRHNMSISQKKRWEDPEVRRRQSELQTKRMNDPVVKANCSERMTRRWSDPAERESLTARLIQMGKNCEIQARKGYSIRNHYETTPGARDNRSMLSVLMWENDSHRTKIVKGMSAHYDKPGAREAHSAIVRLIWSDQERRDKQAEYGRKRYEDNPEARAVTAELTRAVRSTPESRAKTTAANLKRYEDPAQREQSSKIMTKRYSDPEERRKQSEKLKASWVIRKAAKAAAELEASNANT